MHPPRLSFFGVQPEMIPSKNLHDDTALRTLLEFVDKGFSDRRHLALACLGKLVGVQQILSNETRLEISPTVRGELDRMMSEVLTCIDVVLANR